MILHLMPVYILSWIIRFSIPSEIVNDYVSNAILQWCIMALIEFQQKAEYSILYDGKNNEN